MNGLVPININCSLEELYILSPYPPSVCQLNANSTQDAYCVPTFNCEVVLWIFSHCFRIGVFLWRACFQISQFYPLSVLLPLSVARDGVLVVPKRSTNRSCSLDEATGQGVLLNVSVQKNTAGSPLASSATPPPINGKEVSPVLEMQKLTIPAVCLPGVIT